MQARFSPAFSFPLGSRLGLSPCASVSTLFHSKLGPGETEAILLAHRDGAEWLLLDERPARRIAIALGLRVAGTLGLLVRAKEKKLLAAVRPSVEALLRHGFRAKPALIELILRVAGEAEV